MKRYYLWAVAAALFLGVGDAFTPEHWWAYVVRVFGLVFLLQAGYSMALTHVARMIERTTRRIRRSPDPKSDLPGIRKVLVESLR